MFLSSPATYIPVATFKTMPIDYDITSYTDTQLQDLLVRASGAADSIMKRSLLAQERTIRYYGDGSNRLELRENPLLYVKRVQIVVPGTSGLLIPVDQLLIDYATGAMLEYTPMLFQGQGYFARFPRNTPVDVTLGSGYGLATAQPTWTFADNSGGGLAPGQYDIAVTAKTMFGETTAPVTTVTTATGSVLITVQPVLGAYLYRAFIAPHGQTPLKLCAESPYTTYGTQSIQILVDSLTPQTGIWQDTLPTADTSAPVLPNAVVEAVRLLALGILWEQNNLANRGISKTQSQEKSVMWRSTEGTSGRGVPLAWDQAALLLKPYSLQAIF